METEAELNQKIERITTAIRDNYPELAQHIVHMPVAVSNENVSQIGLEALSNYYESLLALFRKYVAEHQLQNSNRVYKDHHL